MKRLKIIKQTKTYIAVHKPAGLVVYADDKESEAISCQLQLQKQLGNKKLFPVHRLDKQTCGILVYAFNPQVSAKLAEMFRGRGVSKKYLAIVHGVIPKEGTIDQPLSKNKEKELQSAKTVYQRLAQHKLEIDGEEREYSLVRLEPKTGRYHQLRRHLKIIGHPIVGDPEYGNSWNNRVFERDFSITRTLLSAISLSFADPSERESFTSLKSEPDPDFLKVMQSFGWKWLRS